MVGAAEDLIVCSSGRYLGNAGDVMALGAKLVDDLLIYSLVADEPHAICSGDGAHGARRAKPRQRRSGNRRVLCSHAYPNRMIQDRTLLPTDLDPSPRKLGELP